MAIAAGMHRENRCKLIALALLLLSGSADYAQSQDVSEPLEPAVFACEAAGIDLATAAEG